MLFLAQKGFRVVAHDRRGHGRSSQASDGNDMDGYADDLALVLEALDLRGATLVGHSTGGGEVARYIGRHGTKRVAKAVLLAAVPPIMLQSASNPEGLPREVFDKLPATSRRIAHSSTRTWPCFFTAPAGRGRRLPRNSGAVLALEHAGRSQERLREHQGILRDRPDGGSEKIRRADAGHARRRRPD